MTDVLEPSRVATHSCGAPHRDFMELVSCLLETDVASLRATLESGTTLSALLRSNGIRHADLLVALRE